MSLADPWPILASLPIALGSPWWLAGVAAALAPIALAGWARRRRRHVPAVNVALQCLAVLAAAAALARPSAPIGPAARRGVLVLRDVSASCRGQWERQVPLPEDLPAERYDFAVAVVPAGRPVDANSTRLAAALQLASARRGELAGVVIHTDGRWLEEDWRPAATALGRAGLPVTIVPMESPPADGRIAGLAVRREADGKVHLQVTAEASALMRRVLTVRRGGAAGAVLLERRLDLLAGQPAMFRLTDAPPEGELATYAASLSGGDDFPENDAAQALVLPLRRRIAVVGDSPIPPGALAAAIAGIEATRLDASAAPTTAGGWMDYSAVLLADAKGDLLPPPSRAGLEEAVRSGMGLVLLGAGPHASPADRQDPLNRAAALLANPYQRRPLDLVVVLDASGSMSLPSAPGGGRVKFDQAVEAVMSLRRHLTDSDGLRAITFSDVAQAVYDSAGRPIDFAAAHERLAAVRAEGPTNIEPALRLAASRPAGQGREGLVLVVSDLATQPIAGTEELAGRMRKQGYALAVVAIEPGVEKVPSPAPLEVLASLLPPARVLRRADLTGLSEVFAGFLREARGEALRRGRFDAAMVREALGRRPGPLPPVGTYLLCAPQEGAEVLARAGGEGDPLLAVRRVALGQSIALALPPDPAANPGWGGVGPLTELLTEAAKAVLRPAGDSRFAGQVRRRDGHLAVTVEAFDANAPLNLLALTGELAAGESSRAVAAFPLRQVAPGRYGGSVAEPQGPAALAVRLAGGTVSWQMAIGRQGPPELEAIGADWAQLRQLAEVTGGQIVSWGQAAQMGGHLAARRRTELWPVLLAAAALLMLAEWAAARIRRRPAET